MNIMYTIKHQCLCLLSIAMLSSCNYSAIQPFCPQNVIELSNISIVKANCDLKNGSITVSAIGDNGNLSYSIDSVNFQSTGSFENLKAGSYFLQIKDAMGCFIIQQFVIENQPSDLDFMAATINSNCGLSIGSINITASGGSEPYTYSLNGGQFGTIKIFENLNSGLYAVTIEDGNGCQISKDVTVIDNDGFMVSVESTNSNCENADGMINVVVTGSSGVLQYKLDNGNFQQNPLFNNLVSGSYIITVQDESGCEVSLEGMVLANPSTINLSFTTVSAGCGTNNGSIDVMASGGSGNFLYSLNDGSFQSNSIFSDLGRGTYDIKVQDDADCLVTSSASILSGVSYSNLVSPIISNSCAITGCHVSGTGRVNFTIFSNIQANATGIKSRTATGNMPRTGSLTQEEIDLIACWVDDGALDN